MIIKICEYCHKEFKARRSIMRFCSRLCSNTHHNPVTPKEDKCEICHITFIHNLKRHRTRCDEHIKTHTEVTKKKISNSMMDHKVSNETRHKMSRKALRRWANEKNSMR
jgi:hypothetical protein